MVRTMQAKDQDIVDLNLSWLLKARQCARFNREKATVILGLEKDVTDRVSRLSIGDLNAIARSGVMVFQPRFHSMFWREITESGNASSLAVRVHMLLMAADVGSKG